MRSARLAATTMAAVFLLAGGLLAADGDSDSGDTGEGLEVGGSPVTAEAASTPMKPAGKRGGGARLFETWEAALEGGVLAPVGDLAEVLDPAPLLGLRATTSYYRAWRAVATLSGALLDGPDSPVPVAWIAGAAGLEWRPPRPWIPSPGAALSLYYVRATEDRGPGEEYLFLDDGESEFGIQSGLRWRLPLSRKLGIEAGIRWDLMFTRPSLSHAASASAGAAWTP